MPLRPQEPTWEDSLNHDSKWSCRPGVAWTRFIVEQRFCFVTIGSLWLPVLIVPKLRRPDTLPEDCYIHSTYRRDPGHTLRWT